ncbi:hypothetical protein [Shewanella sp. ECSMB14102]|uniref:hypothetical protein n=1 Tax=Shewanella sp. ECSMB14102 TaxID=1579504 RepID=UPI001269AF2F|nr:hypothetical protein [Shewanella sp. ECSMB14102]
MTPFKLNDCKWFDSTFTGKYANLDLGSEITLPISLSFFSLPWRKELPLLLSLVPVIALATLVAPFIGKVQLLLPACSVIWFLIYIQVRKGRILTQLGVKSSAKEDIASMVFHWVGYHDNHQIERKRAHAVTVKLKNGREYRLSGMAYPLRSLLYLTIFFGYPVTLLQVSPQAEHLIHFATLLAISVLTLNAVMLFVIS